MHGERVRVIGVAVWALLMLAGCAEHQVGHDSLSLSPPVDREVMSGEPASLAADTPSVADAPPHPAGDSDGELASETVPAAAADMPGGKAAQAPEAGAVLAEEEDEFYDPFAKPGEQLGTFEEYDPWERWNVTMFNFNRRLDDYLIKPVAQAYDAVMPDGVERGISRAFHNLGFPARFVNHLLQGKLKGAGLELSRFLLNSTFGIAGTLDFAKEVFDLEVPDEDTGQTFGRYGIKPGPFLLLPIFPQPLTVRDGVGYLFDIAMNPMNWFLPFTTLFPLNIGYQLNERSLNLETFQGVEEATVDLYGAVRNAYLQKRAQEIKR